MVKLMAAVGIVRADICRLIINPQTNAPIDDITLVKHFRDELEESATRANAQVAKSLFQKATGDGPQAVTAGIWWTKCRMGWKERLVAEVEVKSGVLVPPPTVSPEQWIAAAMSASRGGSHGSIDGIGMNGNGVNGNGHAHDSE